MTERMKMGCVGRMLIDLPEEAQVAFSRTFVQGFNIDSSHEGDAEFRERLAAREAQRRVTRDRFGGDKNLESAREVRTDSGLSGKIFVHGRQVTEGTQAKGLELEHYRYENVAVEGLVHANGVSIDLSAEHYDPDRVENLPKLIAQLVPNPNNRIPREAKFCLDRAYFRDPLTAGQRERIFLSANLPRYPDLTIGLISMAGTKPDKNGLIARAQRTWTKGPLAKEFQERLTKLRAAPRAGGQTGDELVVRVYEKNSATVFAFDWEVNGTSDNVLVPHLHLEIQHPVTADGVAKDQRAHADATVRHRGIGRRTTSAGAASRRNQPNMLIG